MSRDSTRNPRNTLLTRGQPAKPAQAELVPQMPGMAERAPAVPPVAELGPTTGATAEAAAAEAATAEAATLAATGAPNPAPSRSIADPARFMGPRNAGLDLETGTSTIVGPCASAALDPTSPVATQPRVNPVLSASTGAMYLPQEAAGWHTPAEAIGLARAILGLFP